MTLEKATTLLKSRRVEDRVRAVHLLARAEASPEQQRLLLAALEDRVNYVAAQAAEALGKCADASIAQQMVERFLWLSEDGPKRDPGCHIRAHLAFAFARLEFPPAVPALRLGLRTTQIEPVGGVPFDTGAHLRANCALALADMRAPGALRDITLLLFDMSGYALGGRSFAARPDPQAASVKVEPRKAAAQALARLGDKNGLLPLAIKLTHPGEEVADVLQECMQAVVELEDERALELLEPYLQHPDPALAAYAALMIAQTRAPEAPALIREAIRHLSGDPLQAAVLALSTLRTEEARDGLHSLAEDGRDAVRLALVEALADRQDAQDRECLRRLAEKDRSAIVRNAAKRAL